MYQSERLDIRYARNSARRDIVVRAAKTDESASKDGSIERDPPVSKVMAENPVILRDDMPVKEAVQLLLEKDISGVPVVDKNGKLVGVLSESDLIWKGAGAPQDHFIIPPLFIGIADAFVYLRDNKQFEEECHKILAKTVREAMTVNVVSISSTESMSSAAKLMLQKKVNRLPVVDGGVVVGVITRHDILKGMVDTPGYYFM
jgi:CBS domain-containing protein